VFTLDFGRLLFHNTPVALLIRHTRLRVVALSIHLRPHYSRFQLSAKLNSASQLINRKPGRFQGTLGM
jgi:hypothetical protein